MQTGIFNKRQQITYSYGRYGYTRGGGKTWHGGVDVQGIDDPTIYMPFYYDDQFQNPKKISGTVTRARIVTDHTNATWEWGYYVCVQLDAGQTPDSVNYLYFCHCEKLLVSVGQKVCSGDALAIMGNTGNAALNNPPYKHCHFEVRKTSTGTGLDPTHYIGHSNTVDTWGVQDDAVVDDNKLQLLTIGPVQRGDAYAHFVLAIGQDLVSKGLYKQRYVDGTQNQILTIGPVQRGDADKHYLLAVKEDIVSKGLYKQEYVD